MTPETAAEQREFQSVNSFLQFSSQQPLLKGVQIFRAGDYSAKNKGRWTPADLQSIAQNFTKLKDAGEHVPPLKSSHEDDNRGNPVLGWAEKVYAIGKDLFADFRLVSSKVMDLIKRKAFRFRSAELHDRPRPWTRPDGTRLGNVLRAVSFVPIPEVKGMDEISATLSDGQLVYVAMRDEPEAVAINFQGEPEMVTKKKKADEGPEDEDTQGQDPEAESEEGTEAEGADDTEAEDDGEEATDGADTEDSADNADAAEEEEEKMKKNKTKKMAAKNNKKKKEEEEAAKLAAKKKNGKKEEEEEAEMQDKEEEEKKKKKYGKNYGYPVPVKNADTSRLPTFGDSGTVIPAGVQFSDEDMQAALDNMDPATIRRMALNSAKAAQQAAFSETKAWVQSQVEAGKIIPAFKDVALALASPNLGGLGKVSYADGHDPLPVNELFRMYVEGTAPSVNMGETAGQQGANSGQETSVNMSDTEADDYSNRVLCGKSPEDWAAMSDEDKKSAVKVARGEDEE